MAVPIRLKSVPFGGDFLRACLTKVPIRIRISAVSERIMRFICCNLMSALLFMHALLGCCWHHAHGESCCSKPAPDRASVAKHESHCSHKHCSRSSENAPQQQEPAEPSEHEDCPGACNFLPIVKTQVDTESGMMVQSFVAYIAWAAKSDVPSQYSARSESGSAILCLPLRLHLLHQILLI